MIPCMKTRQRKSGKSGNKIRDFTINSGYPVLQVFAPNEVFESMWRCPEHGV